MHLGAVKLDHLVYAVQNLQQACAAFAKTTGVVPVYGGAHPGRGTHNALVALAGGAYFELIAPDPEQPDHDVPRWMGVDLLTEPRLSRWAIRDLELARAEQAREQCQFEPLPRKQGSRKTPTGEILRWEMLEPQAHPAIAVDPFVLDWRRSAAHPYNLLPAPQLSVLRLAVSTPEVERYEQLFSQLGLSCNVQLGPVAIEVVLSTPAGEVILR